MKNLKTTILLFLIGVYAPSFAWVGMSTPPLHVEGRFLKDTCGNDVVLQGGWMQPTETWFNGGGGFYNNPTDWTDPDNVAGMLDYLNEAANVMSDTTPRYGREHGWYASFVRMNTDAIGGWTQEDGLVNQEQFDGWIENFLVPYANHLESRGLYFVLSATGPINTPNNGEQNAGVTEQTRLRTFWSTVADAPGVKNANNIMFELMNEPVEIESSPGNGDWGMSAPVYYEAFRDWIQPVIDDVRETGAENVIWVPTLEWQGSPQQFLEYPFTGSNCGIAVHYYPAYGACFDNVSCHNDLWNNNYDPVAQEWPLIITENFWFPENDGLVAGSTENYGNTLKANMEASGNISYMIGFLSDLLELGEARPEDAPLSTKEGSQEAFSWFYEDFIAYCDTTPVTPYIQVNDANWEQTSSVSIGSGDQVRFGPQPICGGTWSWDGCETSGGNREQTIYPTDSCSTVTTYTNRCGIQSTQEFIVTDTSVVTSSDQLIPSNDHDVEVYPIPAANGNFLIDVSLTNNEHFNVRIYTTEGNKVYETDILSSGTHEMNTGLPQGMYLLNINGTTTRKLYIE